MKRFRSLLTLLFSLSLGAMGQQAQPVIRIAAFTGAGAEAAELAALKSLVTSYVVELKAFRVLDDSGQEQALAEAEAALSLGASRDLTLLSADYILGASVLSTPSATVFSLEIVKAATGEKRSVSETLSDRGELILSARRLTRRLFGQEPAQVPPGEAGAAPSSAGTAPRPSSPNAAGIPETSAQPAPPPIRSDPKLSDLAGTWKGDKGLEKVSLFPDGRGLAYLVSGATMKIQARVRGSRIEISQAQKNMPEFYRSPSIDLASARAIAAQARPWKWVFNLSQDGKTLIGVKESVFVKAENGLVNVDNSYTRDALWSRLER